MFSWITCVSWAAAFVRAHARGSETVPTVDVAGEVRVNPSPSEVLALARGVWSPEQRDLVDPLVERHLEDMAVVARRGQAMALVAGRSAPSFRWRPEQLAALRQAAAADGLPPALARAWADLAHDQGLLGPERDRWVDPVG